MKRVNSAIYILCLFSRAPHGARGLKLLIGEVAAQQGRSRPARGAWIETRRELMVMSVALESRPARGAWIETIILRRSPKVFIVAPARGAWIETPCCAAATVNKSSRAPHGARGLKQETRHRNSQFWRSRPARGAWIETPTSKPTSKPSTRRAPHGARGLKQTIAINAFVLCKSRPARGAWIETGSYGCPPLPMRVAPRTGRVD